MGVIEELKALAAAAYKEGKYELALGFLSKAIESQPDDPELLRGIGLTLSAKGDAAGAIAHLLRSAEIQPSAETYGPLAGVYLEIGQYERALQMAKRATELEAMDPRVWVTLARVQHALNRRDDAVRSYERAITLDPAFASAYNDLAWLKQEAGQYEDARTLAERAIQIKPSLAQAHALLAHLEMTAGSVPAAEAHMAQAAAADPAVGSMIYQDIGLRLFQVGQVWGAVKYLREAVRLRPEAVGDLEAHARSYENAADRLALAAICALLRGSDHEAVDLSERARDLARDVLADERRTGLYSALLFLLVSSRSNPTAFENMLESFGREGLRGG